MKIHSGSYGVSGSAYISRDDCLVIEGAPKTVQKPGSTSSVNARTERNKKFGLLSFIIGGAILCIILTLILNIIGLLIGIVVSIAGSFYSEKRNFVDIEFKDQTKVTLECTDRGVKKLMNWSRVQ